MLYFIKISLETAASGATYVGKKSSWFYGLRHRKAKFKSTAILQSAFPLRYGQSSQVSKLTRFLYLPNSDSVHLSS